MATEFIAILNNSYHVEGDERSKSNPGHGYPAHDVKYLEAVEFENQESLKIWIEKHQERSYRIFKTFELQVKTKLDVTLQEKP